MDGQPFVIPTNYARVDETLYVHGSSASRMLRTLAGGVQICVTVTLVDGLVLARSAFHHSANYRSVVMLGRAMPVEDSVKKKSRAGSFHEPYCAWPLERRPPANGVGIESDFRAGDAAGGSFREGAHRPAER